MAGPAFFLKVLDRAGNKNAGNVGSVQESALSVNSILGDKAITGDLYVASTMAAAVANSGNVDIRLISTLERKVIVNVDAQSNRLRYRLYRDTTFTANGTQIQAYAPKYLDAAMVAAFAYLTPDVNVLGNIRFDGMAGNMEAYQITLEAGMAYLLRLTNISGAANDISVALGTFV